MRASAPIAVHAHRHALQKQSRADAGNLNGFWAFHSNNGKPLFFCPKNYLVKAFHPDLIFQYG
jgi:hypothetical protein